MGEAFKTASTHILPRPTGLSKTTGGRISCYPSPSWLLSATPKGGTCGGTNLYRSAALCYSWRSRS
jgi:hypothetical protein